jgi:integrase
MDGSLLKGLAMQLEDFLEQYLNARPVCEGYAKTLRKRTAKLQEFAGRTELVEVLNEATINSFLSQLNGLSPFTKNKYRADFLAIWRAAADDDKVPYPRSRRIRRERTVAQIIECYLEHEARSLTVAAEHLVGAYPNGIARRQFWPAAIRAGWDTGLRRGDLWRIDVKKIRKDRTMLIVQSKTGQQITVRFHPSTIKAINRAGGTLEWVLCEWCFGVHFQEVVALSGISRGTFRWLRRGSGSRIDADNPGQGHKHLGNGRQVFERHYDAKLGDGQRPMPPEL